MKPRLSALFALVLPVALCAVSPPAHARNVNAVADNVIAVHGLTNPVGHKDDLNWVRTEYFKHGFLSQACGTRCTEAQVVAYDGVNQGWDHHEFDSPGCYLARKARDIPGVNIAVIGHSMGGIAAVHMIKDVATGFSGGWSCGIATTTAASWILNIHTISSPFEGSGVAEAMFNPLSCAVRVTVTACSALSIPFFGLSTSTYSVRPLVADAKFNTWLANTGSWPVFTSWGTSAGWLETVALCGCLGGTHDGLVTEASARASHHSKPASWLTGITKALNHQDEVDGTTRACGSFSCNTSTAQDVWGHDFY